MRITVHTVGSKMPGWVTEGTQEYSKRLPRELNLEWRELPLAQRGKRDGNTDRLKEKEGEQILQSIGPGDLVVALDVLGKPWSTETLAQRRARGREFSKMVKRAKDQKRTIDSS